MKHIFKTLLISILSFYSFAVFAQVTYERIEPPSWWAGMQDSSLQLMVYGNKIAQAEASIHYSGVSLKKTLRLENPNYMILDLEIAKNAKPGKVPIVFEYQREILFSVDYELKARENGSRERQGFSKDDVVYLIMPDRFSNGDPANDSVTGMLEGARRSGSGNRHGGDLKGISDELDYIAGLGVTAIWLNPVLENNMAEKSYHGYAITDYYRVDPRFGDNNQYKALIGDCHEKGLKVIMDMVFNHCGSNHWWMHDMPMASWIHQFPEYTRSNFRTEAEIDPYASDYDYELMQTGWFDRTMPDLNQHNEILGKYLVQNSIWWIEFAGLDGIRMDTYPYSYKDFMSNWMKRVKREYPHFAVVGETWLQKETHTAYWEENSPVSGAYSSNLISVTDFPMQSALKDAFNESEGWNSGLTKIYYVLAQDFIYSDPFNNVIFVDNHDLTRFYTSIGEDFNKFKMTMAILLTTRGIPVIYYGTEILMAGPKGKDDEGIRLEFPMGKWQSAAERSDVPTQSGSAAERSDVPTQSGSVIGAQQLEALKYMRTLLNWRKGSEVVRQGKLKQFIPQDGIYVYFRYNEKDAVMVVINKNKESRKLDLSRYNEILKDFHGGRDVISKKVYLLQDGVEVPAETALVLELD